MSEIVRLIHSCRNDLSPELPGTISYDIPNYYENPNGSSSFVNFRLEDPTSSFQLGPLKNCP